MRRLVAITLFLAASVASASAGDPAPAAPPAPTAPTVAPPTTPPPVPTAKAFTLDAAKSVLFVIVKNDPSSLLSGLAHDHAIGATGWTGTVSWSGDDTLGCKVDISVPVSGLEVDPSGYRAKAGLDAQEVSAEDKAKIKENFSGSRQLDAKNYPNITFKGSSCKGSGTSYMVEGDLTLRGTTKKVIVPLTIKADAASFAASGKFTIRGSDFGMPPFSAVGGTLRNQDSLTFVLDLKGQ